MTRNDTKAAETTKRRNLLQNAQMARKLFEEGEDEETAKEGIDRVMALLSQRAPSGALLYIIGHKEPPSRETVMRYLHGSVITSDGELEIGEDLIPDITRKPAQRNNYSVGSLAQDVIAELREMLTNGGLVLDWKLSDEEIRRIGCQLSAVMRLQMGKVIMEFINALRVHGNFDELLSLFEFDDDEDEEEDA